MDKEYSKAPFKSMKVNINKIINKEKEYTKILQLGWNIKVNLKMINFIQLDA
jgi:hypothetical protein